MVKVNSSLLKEIQSRHMFDASACMHCGICTAVCPVGFHVLPRRVFHYALLGLEEKITQNSAVIFSCLLCKMCEEHCPAQVHIAENMRCLRSFINRSLYGLET
jgi:heterodisulfide reductase subunit C